jgi:hypothetical protein
MDEFKIGTHYTGPPESTHGWFYEALGEVRRVRVGDVPIAVHILGGGGTTTGLLEGVDPGTDHDPFGVVTLDVGNRERLLGIPCQDIAAFTLLPDPPLDRSDELGR